MDDMIAGASSGYPLLVTCNHVIPRKNFTRMTIASGWSGLNGPLESALADIVAAVRTFEAHSKTRRLRLRGPRGAQFKFTLAATAQNLRRLGKLIARPPPPTAKCFA